MDTQQSAQGLASLGRYGDTMLVHMSPKEVEGLQGLAMAQGGSLTINPDTGLPEAFILPMLGGAVLSKFMSPMAAGLLIGGATAVTSGDIGKGIMAGLGGFGGADLGKIFTKMGAAGGIKAGAGADVVKSGIADSLPMGTAQNLSMFTPQGTFGSQTMNAALTGPGVGASAIPSAISPTTIGPGVNSSVNAMGAAPSSAQIAESTLAPSSSSSLFGDMGEGFGKFIKDPFGEGFEAFKVAGGEGGVPLETGDAAMKLGSPIAGAVLGGLQPPMPKPYEDPDKGKYKGPQGQLNLSDQFDTGLRLVAKGGAIKSYALGGNVGNPSVGGGLSSLYNRPEGQAPQNISNDAYGLGRLSDLGSEQARYQAQTLGYADGGNVVAGEKGMNLDKSSSLNLNMVGKPSEDKQTSSPSNPFEMSLRGLNGMGLPNAGMGSLYHQMLGVLGKNAQLEPNSYALNLESGKQEAQYATGGYLNGDGDGMSDSIPATIEGKQPARLADGEFVIPADVVSHLGNGSSKAGSKRLYAMLDKVRHARTGNKKQGKEIKADKYLPA